MKKKYLILTVILIIIGFLLFLKVISKPDLVSPIDIGSNVENYTEDGVKNKDTGVVPKSKTVALTREDKIPRDAIKVTPESDLTPPKSLSSEYNDPVPVTGLVNTAGAEDSAFILPDGKTLYFFFTPDVRVPVEKQLLDGVTGIWVSKKVGGQWQKAERVWLTSLNKLSLDGCEFVDNKTMLFCSAREGYAGVNWFSAESKSGEWTNWQEVKFPENWKVGELHEYNNQVFFHSDKAGGKGGLDIWMITRQDNGGWTEPVNIEAVNSPVNEGWPALNPAGTELWFSKNYGLWRSKKIGGEWQEPEQIFSNLAGEASIDKAGNVYFTHHFYKNNQMIEADIYISSKK